MPVTRLCHFALLMLALPLGGCDWQTFKSSVAGTCPAFEAPRYVVKGKRPYDQDWIDGNVEAGIGACNWARPAPRPPQLDAAASRAVAPVPARKRGLLKRIKDRIVPASAPPAVPVAEPAPIAAEPIVVAPIVEPPKPRDPVDELLQPNAK